MTDHHEQPTRAPAETEAPKQSEHCPGLRETRARRTRATIQSAALRLAAERGYDATTVEDVAAESGVSRRTVFNYFATKADMFIIGPHAPEHEAVEAFVTSRGPLLEDLAALLITTVPATGVYGSHAEDFARLRTILRSNPELSSELQQRVRLHTSVIRAAIARRLDTTLEDPHVFAASMLSTALFKGALDLWAGELERCPAASDRAGTADAAPSPSGAQSPHPDSPAVGTAPESLAEAIGLISTSLRALLIAERDSAASTKNTVRKDHA